MAFLTGRFQPTKTSPDYGFAVVVVTMNSSKHFTIVATNDYLREAMVAAVAAFLSVCTSLNNTSVHQFFLYPHVDFFWDNRFVIACDIILRNDSGVFYFGLVKKISGVSLLQKGITDIFLIAENLVDGAGMPSRFTCAGKNTICRKTS